MARGTVYQVVQIGPEVTPGTIVPATQRLLNFDMTPSPEIPATVVKYPGSKAAIGTLIGQEMTNMKYSAKWDFYLLQYILNSLFGAATTTVPGTLSKQRVWTPSPTQPIAPNTYSIEQGSSVGAESYGYGIFTDVTMKWTRQDTSLEGNLIAQKQIRDFTLTSAVPNLPVAMCMPGKVGVWLSTDGTTWNRLSKNLEGDFKFGALHKPVFHVSDLQDSYDDTVEQHPDFQLTLTQEEGTTADTFMTDLYDGQLVYVGIKVLGPLIETVAMVSYYDTLQVRVPCYVTKPQPGDKSGVWANTFTFDVAHNDSFGLASFTIISGLAAVA